MRALKPILDRPTIQAALCWTAAAYIRLVWHTCRWTIIDGDPPRELLIARRPVIIALWHGRLFMAPYMFGGDTRYFYAMISNHRDGRMISSVVRFLGVGTVSGSTSRGGLAALRQAIRVLKDGNLLGITPDGPRGPRMRASEGIVALARHTGAPIFPVSYSTSRRKVLGSWDRFVVPMPFCRGVVVWGQAITVDPDADAESLERARRAVENALNDTARKADRLSGQPVIEPEGDAAPEPVAAGR